MEVIYEDDHIIAVGKTYREIVQNDKTGDRPLSEMLKAWLKKKYCKPGNIFVGITHRLGHPVNGVVIFAKTNKALSRLNEMFRVGEVRKTYWTIVKNRPPQDEGELVGWLMRNEEQSKSYVYDIERPNAKGAILRYRLITHSDRYYLLEIDLKTRRHCQIRCQLARMGCPIREDLKHGFGRSNKDGGTSLHIRNAEFIHLVSKEDMRIVAPAPDNNLWETLSVNR